MSEHDTRTGPTVAATLSQLRSECETCGAWSPFTGRTEQRDGLTYMILRCPNRCADFSVWSRDREPLVVAYEHARVTLTDPDAYQRAFATLLGGDGAAIAALLASPPPELPLFSIEDVAVPRDAVTRWCELVLDWHGWRPIPERTVRIEETLAAAVRLDAPACVDAAVLQIEPARLSAVVDRLTRRFYGHDTSVLDPLRRGRTGQGCLPMSDVQLLRSLSERLCSVATGAEVEIRGALGIPTTPAPLGARECAVTGGVLSRASVELHFDTPRLTRAELEATFGEGGELPRTGPGAAHVLAYEVRMAGAPVKVSLFARFSGRPLPTTCAKSILLRIDPA